MSLKEDKNVFYTSTLEAFVSKYPKDTWICSKDGTLDYEWVGEINEHWRQFDPPSKTIYSILVAIYSLIMSVGCTGNFLVIYLILRSRSLRNPANYLVLNLAISDLLILITNLPILIYNSIRQGPAIGRLGCQAQGFFGGLCGTASIISLTAIAVDRYYVIVFPLLPFKKNPKRSIAFMIFGTWNYSLIFASLPLLGVNSYVPEGILSSCSFDYLATDVKSRVFIFVFFLAAFVFPLSIITFSYLTIYKTVSKAEHLNFLHEAPKTSEMPRSFRIGYSDKRKTDVKIAKTAFIAIFTWILAWSPYAILALTGILIGPNKYLTPMASLAPSLVCKAASCINPIVYALKHPKFQRELRLTMFRIGCLFGCNGQTEIQSAMESVSFSPGSVLYRGNTFTRNNSTSYSSDRKWKRNELNDSSERRNPICISTIREDSTRNRDVDGDVVASNS